MRSYLIMALLSMTIMSSYLPAELQKRQLTREISVQYEEIEQRGNQSRQEIYLKNPHFYWMDTSAMAPSIVAEIDHKGTLKVVYNYEENILETSSEGISRVIFPQDEKGDSLKETKPMEFLVDGKTFTSSQVDFDKIDPAIGKLRAGDVTDKNILMALEAIKSSTGEGENLKVMTVGDGQAPMWIEWAGYKYLHTSGATPEELTIKTETSHPFEYQGSNFIYRFPDVRPIRSRYEIDLKLADWQTLINFAKSPQKSSLPEGSLKINSQSKSDIGDGSWEASFASRHLEPGRYAVKSLIHSECKNTSGWVEKVQNVERYPAKGAHLNDDEAARQRDEIETGVYNWLKSPNTTPFLKLFPLEMTSDWNGSLNYSTQGGRFSVERGDFYLTLLGKEKKGLIINFDYQKGGANSNIKLAGGKETYNHGVDLYNAFVDSVPAHWHLKKFSPEVREDFFKLLMRYVEQPTKAEDEMNFNIAFGEEGVRIGNQEFGQLMGDLSTFYQKHFSEKERETIPSKEIKEIE